MGVEYCLIARGETALVESSVGIEGNASLVALSLLAKLPRQIDNEIRSSFVIDLRVFHVLNCSNGLIFLAMAEESVDRRVPFALLDDLKRELTNRYSLSSLGKSAYELQSDFGPILEDKMTSYSSDTLSRIQSEVTDLRKITVSTVDKLLERGTRLELLVTKTNDMSESAFAFKREAGRIQRHMYWKRVKMGVGIGGVVVVGFYGLVSMICSPTLHC